MSFSSYVKDNYLAVKIQSSLVNDFDPHCRSPFLNSVNETGGGNPVQITGAWPSGVVPGTRIRCVCFVFLGSIIACRLHKRTFLDQTQVSVQLTVSILAGPLLLEGPKKLFKPVPEPPRSYSVV
jgi:hypothetical protein